MACEDAMFCTILCFLSLASNKTSICHEVSIALQAVIDLFPNRYTSGKRVASDDGFNETTEKNKKYQSTSEYSMLVSNCTEIALLQNLSKVDTMLLHSDGDVALSKLGYYEQGKSETSGGVSLFCEAFDGLRAGYCRGTGVSRLKIERPIALLNFFIASTGNKLVQMLQRFHDYKEQDGVYGRVFFTWCPSISELPKAKGKSFTNIPSYSHFAHAAASLFTNKFKFRYQVHQSDIVENDREGKTSLMLSSR